MFVYLSVIILLLCIIHLLFNHNAKARLLRKIPGPKEVFIFGSGIQVIVSRVELMRLATKWCKQWKGIFRLWCFPISIVLIYNPEDIELLTSNLKYSNKSLVYSMLSPWLRNGLLVSNGEKWQQRRKLLTPAFHFNILRQFLVVLQENSQRLVERLDQSAGESVDVGPVLSEFMLHSICETAMGTKLSDETTDAGRSYEEAINDIVQIFAYRFVRVYLYPDFTFNLTSASRAMKKHVKVIHSFTQRVIKDRRDYINENGIKLSEISGDYDDVYKQKRKTAMLDLLLLAEKDGQIDDVGIQEEVDTFMFEGHDTTASGLTFCLMSLANDKSIQDKIFSELQEIFAESDRPASMEDLSRMKYLECCIKESLRLYPPVHFFSRQLYENVTLSGYTVPGNTQCHINILALHRSEHLYKDPLVFDPDRFLPKNCVGRHAYAYIPFSAGPRNCIGQKFAMMQMKSTISEILRKFVLEPVTRHEDIEFTADLVLRNVGPVYVTFVKR